MLQRESLAGIPRPWIRNWQPYLLLAAGVLTLLGLFAYLDLWGNDDPYITYRYSANLLKGVGPVYNEGQRVLSTTAPLYALLLAGLGLLGPDLPLLSSGVGAIALLLSAWVLYRWAAFRGQAHVGIVAALLLTLSSYLLRSLGAESSLYTLLILLGFYAYDRDRLYGAAVALALAAMVRPDGAVAALAVFLIHLARRRPITWKPLVLYVALVGLWYAGLWIYYGSPIPVTLAAKQKQGQMDISQEFFAGYLAVLRDLLRQPLWWAHSLSVVIGLGLAIAKKRPWLILLAWTLLYVVAYTLLQVSRYPWYYAPLAPVGAVLAAEGVIQILRWLARFRTHPAVRAALMGLALIAVVAPAADGALQAAWMPDPRLSVYRDAGEWLWTHTAPDASVGALEVGIVGYYSQREIVDFAGLIQPEVARQLGPDATYHDAATWAIQSYRPDYVLLPQPYQLFLPGRDWFCQEYEAIRDFTNQESLWLTLYRRSDGP